MDLERELTNRYFLGMATEAEDEEIGVRIIEDPIFAEEVTQAEVDLIEDYLEGELSAPEHELFEQQYLISDDRRERVREIALLKKYSALSGEFAAVVEPTVKTTRPAMNIFLRPNWSARRPVAINSTAKTML